MCVIGIAHLASDRYPLIVAANRDERHSRPTAPAAWWSDRPDVLAGRDLVAGGTWLGITTGGRFAAVTNIFDGPPVAAPLSRGTLVGDFLVSAPPAGRYARAIEPDATRYGPFNLLLLDGDGRALEFASNRRDSATLAPGIHACSNNRPGEDWPKVATLGALLKYAIDGDTDADRRGNPGTGTEPVAAQATLADRLLAALCGPPARGSRDSAPESLFIVGPEFGTRCSTVIVVDESGRALFIERSFDATGAETGTRRYPFEVPALATRTS